jgi:hypothetical protein
LDEAGFRARLSVSFFRAGHMLRKVSKGSIFPREDGKVIDEHFGALHTQQDSFSLAHMSAPPGWREPSQIAEFDEVVIVLQGVLAVEAHIEDN